MIDVVITLLHGILALVVNKGFAFHEGLCVAMEDSCISRKFVCMYVYIYIQSRLRMGVERVEDCEGGAVLNE